MKSAYITGAAGFLGSILTEELIKKGYTVCAIVRPDSSHNDRIKGMENLHVVECEISGYTELYDGITKTGVMGRPDDSVFFHLSINPDPNSQIAGQSVNINATIAAVETASKLGCNRFIATGSQAEYGVVHPEMIETEDISVDPITSYGVAKVVSCYLSRQRARELDIEWIWGRVFSLIGKYEPNGRMLPDLYHALKKNEDFYVSSCRQNWDYLDVYDAADALIALAERGRSGEIYNIAHGDYRPLREYTEEFKDMVGRGRIIYGDDPDPFISLQPSVEKIKNDTGWSPRRSFSDSIKDYEVY